MRANPRKYSIDQILRAADQHRRVYGTYPGKDSGFCPELGVQWRSISAWLKQHPPAEHPDANTLAQLLALCRGRPNRNKLPRLTIDQIMRWARAHHRRTGRWPDKKSGPVPGVPGESWRKIVVALYQGHRGLRPTSLARLLHEHGYKSRSRYDRRLSIRQILQWADEHHRRTGRWPEPDRTRVRAAPGEWWDSLDQALQRGYRGLPGGNTLRKLLADHRDRTYRVKCPDITLNQVLAWMKRHRRETGDLPMHDSGPVRGGYPGDTWARLDVALLNGNRSLPGCMSLAKLRFLFFGIPYPGRLSYPRRSRPARSAQPTKPRARLGVRG